MVYHYTSLSEKWRARYPMTIHLRTIGLKLFKFPIATSLLTSSRAWTNSRQYKSFVRRASTTRCHKRASTFPHIAAQILVTLQIWPPQKITKYFINRYDSCGCKQKQSEEMQTGTLLLHQAAAVLFKHRSCQSNDSRRQNFDILRHAISQRWNVSCYLFSAPIKANAQSRHWYALAINIIRASRYSLSHGESKAV